MLSSILVQESSGKANEIVAKAKKEAKKRLVQEDGVQFATILNNRAIRLSNMGNYIDAIAYAEEAKEGFEKAQNNNFTLPMPRC